MFGGTTLKLMPAVQNILTIAIIGELLLSKKNQPGVVNCTTAALATAFICFWCLYAAYVYVPLRDLNSTGRLTSIFPIFSPSLVCVIARHLGDQRMKTTSLALLPIMAAYSSVVNPSLVAAVVIFMLPTFLFVYGTQFFNDLFSKKLLIATSILVGLVMLASDPYILSYSLKLASKHTPSIQNWLSVSVAEIDNVAANQPKTKPPPAHMLLLDELRNSPEIFVESAIVAPKKLLKIIATDRTATALKWLLLFLVLALLIRFRSLRKRSLAYTLGAIALLYLLTICNYAMSSILKKVATQISSFELRLFAEYNSYIHILFIPAGGGALLLYLLVSAADASLPTNSKIGKTRALLLCVIAFTPIFIATILAPALLIDPLQGWPSRISRREATQFRDLEEKIPALDAILLPATHQIIGDQHWILPTSDEGRFMPFSRGGYLFNVHLGHSVRFDWQDFEKFCGDNPNGRRAFMNTHSVNWFFVSSEGANTQAAFRAKRYCGERYSIADLGGQFPPEVSSGGKLAFYRIRP